MIDKEKNRGFRRLYNALIFSLNGMRACYKTEEAFRQEVWFSLILIPLALWLSDSPVETLLLIGSVLIVLIIELLNTGIERAIDRISFEKHTLSKEAKDMGSAAVLLSLLLCALVWGLIIGEKLFV